MRGVKINGSEFEKHHIMIIKWQKNQNRSLSGFVQTSLKIFPKLLQQFSKAKLLNFQNRETHVRVHLKNAIFYDVLVDCAS